MQKSLIYRPSLSRPAVAGLDVVLRILSDATARASSFERPELTPQAGQQRTFVEEQADVVIYGGQAGGGKSYGLLISGARYVHEPKYSAVIFRRTMAQVTKPGGLWEQAMKVYPPCGATPRYSSRSFIWPSGATVSFGQLESESSKLDWQGAELDFIGFDELTHFTEGQFWYLFSRARSKTPTLRPRIRATCNPDPDSFVADLLLDRWISRETGLPIPEMRNLRKHFVRDGERLVWGDRPSDLRARVPDREPHSLVFIPAALTDNPAGQLADPGYAAMLDTLPSVERERLKFGNWRVRQTAGRVFSRAWFRLVEAVPTEGREVRYWDKAGTEGGGCRSVGVRMMRVGGRYTICDVVAAQHEAARREALIRQTAELDGKGVEVVCEQEPGSGGKESAQATVRSLAGWRVYADRVTGSKLSRWLPFAAQAEAGNVDVLGAPWTREFLDDLHNADGEKPKNVDAVDAAAGAFAWLTRPRLTTGIG